MRCRRLHSTCRYPLLQVRSYEPLEVKWENRLADELGNPLPFPITGKDNGELFYPTFPGDPFYADFITGEGAILPPDFFPGGGACSPAVPLHRLHHGHPVAAGNPQSRPVLRGPERESRDSRDRG